MAQWRLLGVLALVLAGCSSDPAVVELTESAESSAAPESATSRPVADDSAAFEDPNENPQELSVLVQNEVLLGTTWQVAQSEPIADSVERLAFEGSRADAVLTVDATCGQVEVLLEPIPHLHKFNVRTTSWNGCADGVVREWLETEQVTVAINVDDTSATFVSNSTPTQIELLDAERSFTVSDGIPVWSVEPDDESDQEFDDEPVPALSDETLASEVLLAGMQPIGDLIEDTRHLALIAAAQYIVVDGEGAPVSFNDETFDKLTLFLQAYHGKHEPVVYYGSIGLFSEIHPEYGPQTDACNGGFVLGAFGRDANRLFTFEPNGAVEVFDDRILIGDYGCGSKPEIAPDFLLTSFTLDPTQGGDVILTTTGGQVVNLELVAPRQ